MGRRKNTGRPVNGILLFNKPAGITSNAALQRVRRLFDANKAGHTGSLDPLATGVLPICLGEATKFTQFLLDADKVYRSTFRLGRTTSTGDAEGEMLAEVDASSLTATQVELALQPLRGAIQQVPPMYSALKRDGRALYTLARQGLEVERQPRPVTVHEFRMLTFRSGTIAEVDVEIRCSKGTYVRTLAEDLGRALGCGGHVGSLHRSGTGPFDDSKTVNLEQLELLRRDRQPQELDFLLLPMETAVADLLQVDLPETTAWYLQRGQAVMVPRACREAEEGDIVRIFQNGGQFLGIGEILEDGRVAPRRLVVE